MAGLGSGNAEAKSSSFKIDLDTIQRTVTIVTLFNKRPKMADLRKIHSIKQKGVDKYGISTFNYSCTAPVATDLKDSTDSNIGPINANSKFRKYYITDQELSLIHI